MTSAPSAVQRVLAVARAVVAARAAPVPRAAMLRSGGAIGFGFVILLTFGSIEQAVVCAIFTNFLCFIDKANHLGTRLWVQLCGAALSVAAGGVGLLVAGNPPMILLTTFAIALVAGYVHGSSPGVEAIPRYALICLVVCAFLPIGHPESLVAVALATTLSLATILLDDHLRHGRRGIRIARIRTAAAYPGPRFSLIYGAAAALGLAIGLIWIDTRPYWVTITTILVMQPDRRANTVRVLQRFLGTIAGVVFAFLIVAALPPGERTRGLLLAVVSLPFLWPFGFDRNYGLGVAILSTWVLLLIDTALPPSEFVGPLFLARLSNTAVGCAVALAGSFVVFEAQDEEVGSPAET